VIEALRDRIDIVVKALHFNTRFLGDLLARIEQEIRPEQIIPAQIIFTEHEIDEAHRQILGVEIDPKLRRRIGVLREPLRVLRVGGGADRVQDEGHGEALGGRPEPARRVGDRQGPGQGPRKPDDERALGPLADDAARVREALTWFRGGTEVSFDDVRQVLPSSFTTS